MLVMHLYNDIHRATNSHSHALALQYFNIYF